MEIPVQTAIQFHELLVILLTAFILFVAGTWLSEKIKSSVNKKATMHGTQEVCGACAALIEVRRIPEMDKLQKELRARDGTLAKLDKTVTELTVTTTSLKSEIADLKADVSKLFTMIEGDWQEQIRNLKNKLAEKDQQIRRLEDIRDDMAQGKSYYPADVEFEERMEMIKWFNHNLLIKLTCYNQKGHICMGSTTDPKCVECWREHR